MFRNRTAVAVAFVIGILVLGGLIGMSSIGSTTVSASQVGNRGGATEQMLDFALNFKGAASFEQFGANGARNAIGGAESSSNAIDPQAGVDLQNAMRAIDQLPCEEVLSSSMSGRSFGPGVYCLASANLAGAMTLDAGGDANARFVFRVAGDIKAEAGSTINFDNGAASTNAYFVSGSDVSIGENSHLGGTVLASGDINVGAGTELSGRAMSVKGSVNASEANIAAATGFIEICKDLAAGEATITPGTIFSFNVTGVTGTIDVPAGRCSFPTAVTAGVVTVTEVARANTAVIKIAALPADRLIASSVSLPTRTANFNVPAGDATNETLVRFVNQTTRTGSLEICKYGLDTDVTGFFTFTVEGAAGTFTVPVGFCSDIVTTTLPVTGVQTGTFPVRVTELARATFRLERVDTLPVGLNTPAGLPGFVPDQGINPATGATFTNTNGGYTTVTLNTAADPTTASMILVNFYNRSLPGLIKVCKIAADTRIPSTTQFLFDVSGTAPTSPSAVTIRGVAVYPGSCTLLDQLFVVGTPVTVTEVGMNPDPSTQVGSTTTFTFADIRVSRIDGNPGVITSSINLVNKTANLNARNSLATINFYNFIFRPALLKVCKAAAVAGTDTTPRTATLTLSLVDPLTSYAVPSTPINLTYSAAGAGCALISGPFRTANTTDTSVTGPFFPGYGTFNRGTRVIVTEASTPGFTLTAITSPTNPAADLTTNVAGGTGTLALTLAPNNINEIRFVNAPTVAPPVAQAARFDFDGDHKSDMAIYRGGTWWYAASASNSAQTPIQFGIAGDKLVAADYDGDGKTDAAVYRNGTWFVLGSTSGLMQMQFGLATDIPQPGDFDGDGKADFAVFRPSDGVWYVQGSTAGFSAAQFGIATDKPVAADFDGDGKMDPAVYRNGTWYVLGSTAGFYGGQFGVSTDIPVQADFDGDHKADFAVYRSGTWYILGSTSGFKAVAFGLATDIPVPADYDGDGMADIAVYRTSTTVWHILQSSQAQGLLGGYVAAQFGSSNDVLMNY